MANQIFQLKNISIGDDYVHPTLKEGKTVFNVQYLHSNNTHAFFSFNPEDITVKTDGINLSKYDVKILDKTDEDTAEVLSFIKSNSQYIKLTITDIEAKISAKYSLVTLFSKIAANDLTVKSELAANVQEKADFITGLGF